jgi:transposase
LSQKGQSHAQVARTLGVTEGAVRYHRRRAAARASDGRRGKPHKADPLAHVIDHRVHDGLPDQAGDGPPPPVNVRALHDYLVHEHAYGGSYRSVLRFVRANYPSPRLRPFRRVETPPGAQAQADWGELAGLDIGRGPQALYAFVMVLSHSRKEVVVWSERMDQLAWHHAHNEAFRRLGGVPAVVRIDNLKTGVAQGGRAVGPGQPGVPQLRPLRRVPRRRLPPPMPRGQGQGREQGRRRPAAAAAAGSVPEPGRVAGR